MDERRYRDEEVERIFRAAAAAREDDHRRLPASAEGLTLAELQEIGREVGLPPERIAEAASALDAPAPRRRTQMGLPVSVGRVVDLPRAPTDREWELLVAELRETFLARGRVRSDGGLRQWNNGHLHAYVEPAEDGYRLRLGTLKGDAAPLGRAGIVGILVGLVLLVLTLLTGEPAEELFRPLLFLLMGGVALGYNAVRLPAWAREREAQMEHVAARARALIGPGPASTERDEGEDGG